MRRTALALTAALLLAPAARAQTGWQSYDYSDAGFLVQFPAAPSITHGTYRTQAGIEAPTTVYAVEDGDIRYSVTVADFSKTALGQQGAIDDAAKTAARDGEVKADVEARIDAEYGRELSVLGKDGSRSVLAVFFFHQHLYELQGLATGGDAAGRTGQLIRFQQSLQFSRFFN